MGILLYPRDYALVFGKQDMIRFHYCYFLLCQVIHNIGLPVVLIIQFLRSQFASYI